MPEAHDLKSIDTYKRDAARLLKAVRADDATARDRFRRLENAPAGLQLKHALTVIAHEAGFPTWTALKSAAEEVVVTGSRIARPNLTANSPIAVVTGEQTTNNADITLDTYLNTLPQVNPAGTSTSSPAGPWRRCGPARCG